MYLKLVLGHSQTCTSYICINMVVDIIPELSTCWLLSTVNDIINFLITACSTIRRWMSTGECLQVYTGHTSFIYRYEKGYTLF